MASLPLHASHPRNILRPYNGPGLFITATGTDIGKTTVTAALAAALHSLHVRVGICKAVATGCPRPPGRLDVARPGDDDFLCADAQIAGRAAGLDPSDESLFRYMAPIRYADAVSPALAARMAHRPPDWHRLAAAMDYWQENSDLLLVEGSGGWYVPLEPDPEEQAGEEKGVVRGGGGVFDAANSFMMADLAAALRLPVLIVTGPELGTINHTLLTLHAIREKNLPVIGMIINRVPPKQKRDLAVSSNLVELPRLAGVPLRAVLPDLPELSPLSPVPAALIDLLHPFAREWWSMIRTER